MDRAGVPGSGPGPRRCARGRRGHVAAAATGRRTGPEALDDRGPEARAQVEGRTEAETAPRGAHGRGDRAGGAGTPAGPGAARGEVGRRGRQRRAGARGGAAPGGGAHRTPIPTDGNSPQFGQTSGEIIYRYSNLTERLFN